MTVPKFEVMKSPTNSPNDQEELLKTGEDTTQVTTANGNGNGKWAGLSSKVKAGIITAAVLWVVILLCVLVTFSVYNKNTTVHTQSEHRVTTSNKNPCPVGIKQFNCVVNQENIRSCYTCCPGGREGTDGTPACRR